MTKEELKEIIEAVLERLAKDETPQNACLWWDYVCADDSRRRIYTQPSRPDLSR